MIIYIAGPYTKGDVADNVRRAMEAGNIVCASGHTCIVPHLYHFMHLHIPRHYEDWMRMDFDLIRKSDALIRLSGESSGSDREVDLADKHGMPVIYQDKIDFEKFSLGKTADNLYRIIQSLAERSTRSA